MCLKINCDRCNNAFVLIFFKTSLYVLVLRGLAKRSSAKKKKRKAERKWRTTKLQSDLLQFKRKRAFCTFLMKKARSEYYSTFINDNSFDQRKLFKASKHLLHLKDDIQFPPHSQ